MRLGLYLDHARPVVQQARAAEAAGFDLLWIDDGGAPSGRPAAAVVTASFLAGVTRTMRVVVAVRSGPHPVWLAEEAAVADLALGGRLGVALRAGDGGPGEVDETATVLRAAWTARPFRHDGERWTVPANRPGNTGWVEHRIRVTPAPAQFTVPLWLVVSPLGSVAASHGIPLVGDAEAEGPVQAAWRTIEGQLGHSAHHLARPALIDLASMEPSDVDPTRDRLVAARQAFGLDIAVLRLPAALDARAWREAVDTIAHELRPRVQMEELPPGTEAFWSEQRARQIEEAR